MKMSSNESIQRGGGEDPRRYMAKNVIERKVSDHSQSGYNLQTAPNMRAEEASFKASQEGRAASMGEMQPDGIFRY